MRVEIVLLLVFEAALAAAPQYENDGLDFKVLKDQGTREDARVRKNMTVNVHPGDVEVIKDAIKKLLGRDEIDHIKYHVPTGPTRSPPTDEATRSPNTPSLLSSLTPGLPMDPEGLVPTDRPDEIVSDRSDSDGPGTDKLVPESAPVTGGLETQGPQVTRTGAIRRLDWFDKQEAEYSPTLSSEGLQAIFPGVAEGVSRTTAMAAVRAEHVFETLGWEYPSQASPLAAPDDTADIDVGRLRKFFDNRTRHTRRTTGSTRNTLCTELDDEACRTMCFDKEKYRVSCTTTRPPATTPQLDITKLLKMISSLVADYDTNLTAVMNKTLFEKGYKDCDPTTTLTTTTTLVPPPTPPMYDYEPSELTGSVISKCFVCGMEELGIPLNAHCADPFAKDLLPPAMPDHVAETKRKGFRKYCNYMDMKPWYINGSGIWGKWSGGCVVRWVDLSGIYTQRVCRIRDRPAIGRHFVSKRLAKLEFALRKVDNGCMLSPMATLVPFSRGVSLYARLHVCVCSANWCNAAKRLASSWLWAAIGLLAAVNVNNKCPTSCFLFVSMFCYFVLVL